VFEFLVEIIIVEFIMCNSCQPWFACVDNFKCKKSFAILGKIFVSLI